MMNAVDAVREDEGSGRPTIASRLAVASFASGLVLCCPGTAALAIVTGTVALLLGVRESNATWRKFAVGGLSLGILGMAVLGGLYFGIHGWWEREGRILYSGPNNALVALDAGSLTTFRAEFDGAGAEASDAEIQAFSQQLTDNFGRFRVCRSTRQTPPDTEGPGPWSLGQYEAVFSKGDPPTEVRVPAEVGIARLPSGTLRLTWVVLDPDGVRVGYPPQLTEEVTGK